MTVVRSSSQNVIFVLFPGCEILDVAGPLQVFHQANESGADYSITFASPSPQIATAQRLTIAQVAALPAVREGDLIIVPGYDFTAFLAAPGVKKMVE